MNIVSDNEIIFTTDHLNIVVLGGLRHDMLDTLRVTLKISAVTSTRPPLRINIDLYNDHQLDKLIRKVAQVLQVGTAVIEAALSDVINQMERYRLDRLAQHQYDQNQQQVSDNQRDDAIAYLKDPDLLLRTESDLHDIGITGEAQVAIITYLVMTSRKLHQPLSVVLVGKKYSGKSYILDKISGCLPPQDIRQQSALSDNSIYYLKRHELQGKVFIITDIDYTSRSVLPIAQLQTKKRLSKTVTVKDRSGLLRTVTLTVEGRVAVVGTSTTDNHDTFTVYTTTTSEHDEQVMRYQKDNHAGITDAAKQQFIQQRHQVIQSVLQPINIVNPYATLIVIPKEIYNPRQVLQLLLNFIDTITYYHQYQREQHINHTTGEISIATHPDDIVQAVSLLREILLRKADELPQAVRIFYEWLRSWRTDNTIGFYTKDIRDAYAIHPRTLTRHVKVLLSYGAITITGGNKNHLGFQYKLSNYDSITPTKDSITSQLDDMLKNIWEHYNSNNSSDKPENLSKTVRHSKTKP